MMIYTFGGVWDEPGEAALRAQKQANDFINFHNVTREQLVSVQTTMSTTLVPDEDAVRVDVVITLVIEWPAEEDEKKEG